MKWLSNFYTVFAFVVLFLAFIPVLIGYLFFGIIWFIVFLPYFSYEYFKNEH